jgi:hypothetical protein
MQSRDFAFWLQGFFEVSGAKAIDETQTEMIKKHLELVFVHEIDPAMGGKGHQAKLNSIHSNGDSLPGKPVMRC